MSDERRYVLHVDVGVDQKMLGHLEFLARVSRPASERLYNDIIEKLENIRRVPECYSRYIPAPSRQTDAILRYTLFGKRRYRIVFEVIGADLIRVYDIQDCRQNYDKNLV